MATTGLDIKQLLEAGAHFGHKTSRWHPKMAPYIHSKRGGSHIIDLTKTIECLEVALNFVSIATAEGKQLLFVGTKRQAQSIVKDAAETVKMPYVTERWLGGMLTNASTMNDRVRHLRDLEAKMESGELASKYNKLEVQRFQAEIDSMNKLYGGIKNMTVRPGAVFIVDIIHDANALREARKLGLPVIAIVDTNANPGLVDYPIPANDDAIKAIKLITDYIRQAVEQGKAKAAKGVPDKDQSTEAKQRNVGDK